MTATQIAEAIYDEALTDEGEPRPGYESLLAHVADIDRDGTLRHIRRRLHADGCVFGGVGASGEAFKVDLLPRVICGDEWLSLARGLEQRVRALDAFLRGRSIVAEGVIPHRVVSGAEYFEPELKHLPPQPVLVALAGLDIVRTPSGEFQVLEDNLRTPSGLAYAFAARRAVTAALGFGDPLPVQESAVAILSQALRGGDPDARLAVLTDGPRNSAYWEHSILAELLEVPLVTLDTLDVDEVDFVYRRTDEDRLRSPDGGMTDVGAALIDHLRVGKVHCVNALGNGVADDKLLHAYVEDMVRFYLDEEPRVRSVPTFDLCHAESMDEVLDRMDEMVVKPRSAYGGEGVFVGPHATQADRDAMAETIRVHPEDWIAQETVFFSTHPTYVDGTLQPRHVDLRAFVAFDGMRARAIPGGLSRVAYEEGNLVVNSSQGGGGKDTWILADRP
jgi:carboxylate-amine ligase